MNSRRKIFSYNALKGIGAMGILFSYMSYLAEGENIFWRSFYDYFMRYGSRCSSLFFVISGFFLAYTWKNADFGTYIKGKLKRIYPLTLFVFILAFACSFIQSDTVNGDMAVGSPLWIISIILNITLLKAFVPNRDIFYSFHGPSWYISVLFVSYIIGYFMVKKIKNLAGREKALKVVCGGISLVYLIQLAICVWVDVRNLDGLYLTYVNPYFRIWGENMLGVMICEYMPKIQGKLKKVNWNRLEITALLVWFGFFVMNNINKSSIWSAWIWFIPIGFLMIAFYEDAGILSRASKTKPLVFLGDISFELYMTHAFVYEGLPIVCGIVNESLRRWIIYHAGTRFLITLFGSIVFAYFVHILMQKITMYRLHALVK